MLSSCSTPQGGIESARFSRPIRVACVGDSITFGHGIADRERNCYPAQLQDLLGQRWQVRNFGFSGATALKHGTKPYSQLPSYLDALSFEPDVVILKLGTNDTNARAWPQHKQGFAADYRDIIRAFRKLETRPRIFICIPVPLFRDRGKAYDTDKILTEEVIPKIKEVARKERLPVIDLYAAFADKPEMLPDGVHPNAEGARLMAEQIYAKLTGRSAPASSK